MFCQKFSCAFLSFTSNFSDHDNSLSLGILKDEKFDIFEMNLPQSASDIDVTELMLDRTTSVPKSVLRLSVDKEQGLRSGILLFIRDVPAPNER